MNSIINFKIWKKYIKRFSKKKVTQGESSCSKINHTQKFIPISELGISCKTKSFEQLSQYSTDSLEEKSFSLKKYGIKRIYNKKSESLESFISNSNKSDISEDSLQRGSLSKEDLCQSMMEHVRNINDSAESLNMKAGYPNKVFNSKYQMRDRSHTVGQSYQLEKMLDRRSQTYIDEQSQNHHIPLNYKTQLSHHEAVSIDSLDNLLTGRLHQSKKQFISEDSINIEKQEYFDKFSNGYRKKSISDGLLHETRYIQHLLHNRDVVILSKILSNEIKNQDNIEETLMKSNQIRPCLIHLIALIELQSNEKYDSLKPFSINNSSFIQDKNENCESEDEKFSIDSLSIPQSELLRNRSFRIKKESLKRNKSFSSNISDYKYCKNGNLEKFYCSPRTIIHHYESMKFERNHCYHFTMHDRKCNINAQDFKKSSSNNQFPYNSMDHRENEKEDSISIDSLCDSLN